MKKFRRFMVRALVAGLLAFLIVPFLLPQPDSGTLTNQEAAGSKAEFVRLANLDVHIERQQYTGTCNCNAPLIVLMHGFGASTFSWREVIEPLGEFGEVIAYDRPAFGFTERPTEWANLNPYGFEGNFAILDDLLKEFATNRKVILVGHSAGGQLAAEYARLNPGKVNALVLVDPAILTTGGAGGLDWLYGIPQIQKLGPILVSSIASSGDNVIRQSFFDQTKLTQAVFDGYRRPLKVKGWELAFWNFVTAPRDNKLKENIAELKTPTLLITGSNDTIVPTADTIELDKLIPNSTLAVIPKSGHLPHEEQPDAFMTAIEANFNTLLG